MRERLFAAMHDPLERRRFLHPFLGDALLHRAPRRAVTRTRVLNEHFAMRRLGRRQGRQGLRRERMGGDTVDHKLDVDVVLGQVHKIVQHEFRLELLFEELRVLRAHAKRRHRTDVAENGVPHPRIVAVDELADVLIRENETEVIFAGLGEDIGERIRGKVLELVHVREEILALALRHVHTRHGRKLKPRDDHRAQEPRIVLADLALREVHDEDLPLVHDLPHVNGRTRLAEDVPYQGIRDELPDFVLDRGHRLGLQTLGIAGEFVRPERLDDRIGEVFHDPRAVRGFGEHAHDAQKRRIGILEKRQDGVVQNVLHARGPDIGPDLLEDAHHAGRDEMPELGADLFERVERDRMIEIERREIDHVVDALFGHEIEHPLREFAVRIDDRETVTGADVVDRHGLEEVALPGTGLADHVHVAPAIVGLDAEPRLLVAEIGLAEDIDLFVRELFHSEISLLRGQGRRRLPFPRFEAARPPSRSADGRWSPALRYSERKPFGSS